MKMAKLTGVGTRVDACVGGSVGGGVGGLVGACYQTKIEQ